MSKKQAVVFDGRRVVFEKEMKLEKEIEKLIKKGITPELVSIVVGDAGGGKFYQNLKKEAAKRVGAQIEIRQFQKGESVNRLIKLIKKLNQDESVHGIMVQLPLPNKLKRKTESIINAIVPEKDVDGMKENSPYLAPVVMAVLEAVRQSSEYLPNNKEAKVVVIGAKGFVGGKIVKVLEEMGYHVAGYDIKTPDLKSKTKEADILVSATGQPGLINGQMVKNRSIVIDVGSPRGDVKFDEVVSKASFITPVPGGIGPVTISYLLENLIEAASSKK